MSVTLVLVPVSMSSNIVMGLISSIVASSALTIKKNQELEKEIAESINELNSMEMTIEDYSVANAMQKQHKHLQYQTMCSQYTTIFKDESLLIKTLKEHELQEISVENGKIKGEIDLLSFEFEKDEDGVYQMHITHKENADLSIVNDLKEEYQLNAQEQSYMNIKKNLEKQNLSIDSEEVLEDNSIMLTVNLW